MSATVYKMVQEKPLVSVQQGYKDVRSNFTTKMSEEERIVFLSMIPSLQNFSSNLYKFRNKFVAKCPKGVEDFDTKSDWFMLPSSKETIVKDRQFWFAFKFKEKETRIHRNQTDFQKSREASYVDSSNIIHEKRRHKK